MAGGLKRELITKHGVRPEVHHQYHELEILVNDHSVFSYHRAQSIPTVESLLALVEESAKQS